MTAFPNVQGVDETIAALREFPKATGRNTLRRALVKAVNPMAVVARSYAPDDPGTPAPDLKSSIAVATQLTRRQRSTKANEVEVHVGPTRVEGRYVLNYASFVEFGTYRAKAHPYMRPAWDRTKDLVFKILAKELTIEFEKAGARLDRKFSRSIARNFKG
jgi:HK97 gp10 family phage protein